jgi:excisionase family DNA binding protein
MSAEEIGGTSTRIKATRSAGEMASETLLTLGQVADRLQVSRTTIWRLTHEQGLRTVRCAGVVRVRASDLANWIEKHCTDGNRTDEP